MDDVAGREEEMKTGSRKAAENAKKKNDVTQYGLFPTAIGDSRMREQEGQNVSFQWTDRAHGNTSKTLR
jgi:hypothetical protein